MWTKSLSLIVLTIVVISLLFLGRTSAYAQGTIECGDIVQGQFTQSNSRLTFSIPLQAGSRLNIRAEPIGDYLGFTNINFLYAPSGAYLMGADYGNRRAVFQTGVLGETGFYVFTLNNASSTGSFNLYIGCTLPDGTVVNPGDKLIPSATPTVIKVDVSTGGFSGFGFPGLPATDFSSAVTVSLQDSSNNGKIPATGNTVLGYTFSAHAGNTLDLSFTRVAGNLNLGLVVLSNDNKVVFQASLINTQTMSARFSLPTEGEYTIGVFRIDLLPPDNPQPTEFTIQGKLSS